MVKSLEKSSCLSRAIKSGSSRCCCGLFVLLKPVFCIFVRSCFFSVAHVSTCRMNNYNKRKLFFKAMLSVTSQQQRLACEWVWMLFGAERLRVRLQTGVWGTNSHKHVLNETPQRTQILPQLARAAFSNTVVPVWAKFLVGAVCPTGCSTINSPPSISQSLTNVTLFSAAHS